MSYAPFPPNDGSDLHDSARPAGFRLSDAESIAADRLETEGDGSLKDALASVAAPRTPADEVEHLADRIEAAQAGYNTAHFPTSTLPFLAEPEFDFSGAGPAQETLLDMREWSEAQAAVASELAEAQSQPLFLQEEARQAGGGTHWQAAATRDADPYAHSADAAAGRTAVIEPYSIVKPMPEAQALPEAAPIANALDAAAKLAADANAAAEALESLTRLLHNHQRPTTVVPFPPHVAQRPPEPAPRPPQPTPRPVQVAPTIPIAQHPQPAPRPAATRPVAPPTLRPTPPAARERRQFDVRGFVAGFALSWAIGAMLYIYLMAG